MRRSASSLTLEDCTQIKIAIEKLVIDRRENYTIEYEKYIPDWIAKLRATNLTLTEILAGIEWLGKQPTYNKLFGFTDLQYAIEQAGAVIIGPEQIRNYLNKVLAGKSNILDKVSMTLFGKPFLSLDSHQRFVKYLDDKVLEHYAAKESEDYQKFNDAKLKKITEFLQLEEFFQAILAESLNEVAKENPMIPFTSTMQRQVIKALNQKLLSKNLPNNFGKRKAEYLNQ